MKRLLVGVAIILPGARHRAEEYWEAGHGYRGSSVLTAGIPGGWEAVG